METVSGIWGGRYWYSESPDTPIPFSAWLAITGSFLNGTTLESNTIVQDGPGELEAEIDGTLQSDLISFCKTYQSDHQPPVFYFGILSVDRTRICGEWHLNNGGFLSGDFEMSRIATLSFTVEEAVLALKE